MRKFGVALLLGALSALVLAAPAGSATGGKLPNGDFERGSFARWSTNATAGGGWFIYSLADWQDPSSAPDPPGFDVGSVPRPRGNFSPMSLSNQPAAHSLTRTIKVPKRARKLRLRFFWNNEVDRFAFTGRWRPGDETGPANQFFSIDLLKPRAKPFTANKKQVLRTIFKPQKGPAQGPVARASATPQDSNGWLAGSAGLKPYRGKKVTLRLVEVDNQAPLYVGLDDVRIELAKKRR
jgi:hypothetical protein